MTLSSPPSQPPASTDQFRRWMPQWSPEDTDPTLPPLTVITDQDDDRAYTISALAAQQPEHGRIVVHPTPVATAPAYLAHDLIRALGKHLPLENCDPPWWIGNADESWRIAAAWTRALDIRHYIVCRAHLIPGRHWEHLMALREHTRVQLTLVVNAPPPPVLTDILTTVTHQQLDTLEGAHQHLHAPAAPGRQPVTPYPWWEAAVPFPPPSDEPWYELPARPKQPRRNPHRKPPESCRGNPTELWSAQHPPPATPLPHPMSSQEPTPHHAAVAQRIHSRIAHPVHAAAVAVRTLTGYDTDQLCDLHADTTASARGPAQLPQPLPDWAELLFHAARILTQLQGFDRASRLLSLSTWEMYDTELATEACRLVGAPAVARRAPKPAPSASSPAHERASA